VEALVYEELDRAGGAERYATIMGRAQTAGTLGVVLAMAIASPVLEIGGYLAVGAASSSCAFWPRRPSRPRSPSIAPDPTRRAPPTSPAGRRRCVPGWPRHGPVRRCGRRWSLVALVAAVVGRAGRVHAAADPRHRRRAATVPPFCW
jgi:hypothetical protein